MISDQTAPRFHDAIRGIIEKTSVVSLLAASAAEWPIWKTNIGILLAANEVNLTLAWQWIDKTPDAQRMLRGVVEEWAIFEPIPETVDFWDVKFSIQLFCLAKANEGDTPETQAFRLLAEAFK